MSLLDRIRGKKEQPRQQQAPQPTTEDMLAFKKFQVFQQQMAQHAAPEYEEAAAPADKPEQSMSSKIAHSMSGGSKPHRRRRIVQPRMEEEGELTEVPQGDDLSELGSRINILRRVAKGSQSTDGSSSEGEQDIGVTDAEARLIISEELMHPKKKWQDVITISPPHVIQPFTIATSLDQIEPVVISPKVPDTAKRDYIAWLKRMTNGSQYSEEMKAWIKHHDIDLAELEKQADIAEQEGVDFDPKTIKREDLPYYKMSTQNGVADSGVENFIYRHDRRMMSFKGESQKNALELLEIKGKEEESMRETKKF